MIRAFAIVLLVFSVRLDAQTMRHFLPNTTRLSDIVFTPDGRAWVASSEGIISLSQSGVATTVAPDDDVERLAVGADGAVWANTYEQVIRIDPLTGSVDYHDIGPFIAAFGAGPDGALWLIRTVASVSSLVRLSTSGAVLSSNLINAPPQFGLRLVAMGGAMWTSTFQGVVRLTATGGTHTFPLPMANTYFFASAGDFLWVAEGSGSKIIRVGPDGSVLAEYDLSAEEVIGGMIADADGNLWIGGMSADAEGNLWMTQLTTGRVVRMAPDGQLTVIATFPDPLSDCYWGPPKPMAVAADGRVAVGTWGQLSPLSPPYDPCWTDPNGQSVVVIFNSNHIHEVPTLGSLALALAALLIVAAGVFVTGRL